MFRATLFALAGLLLAPLVVAQPFQEGQHYRVLGSEVDVDDPDRIEVREFFFYGCPHCHTVQSVIEGWEETKPGDVNFVRTPVVFMRGAEPLARAFYVARAEDLLDEVHMAIFEALHNHNRNLFDADALADFFTAYDMSREEFNELYQSFGVSTQVRQADAKARQYQISGTPAFTVNGKYVVLRRNLANDRETFEVIDYLVERERERQ